MSDPKTSSSSSTPRAALRLPDGFPETPGPVRAWVQAASGKVQYGKVDSLADLPAPLRAHPMQVWLPAGDVLLATARVPTKSRARIQQALPFALEEQVIGDPESMDYRWIARNDGSLAVAVTAKARLESVMSALQVAAVPVASLSPPVLALPYTDGAWTAAWDRAEWLVRTGRHSGFACAPGLDGDLPAGIRNAIAEAKNNDAVPEKLTVLNPPGDFNAAVWTDALGVQVDSREEEFWAYAESGPFNLVTRADSAGVNGATLRRVLPAIVMLVVFAIGWAGFSGWELFQLSRQHEAARREMLDLFRKSFPEAKSIVDPALQMARNLSGLQAGGGSVAPGDLLPMLTDTAAVLAASGAVPPRAIQYADGGITVDVTVSDFQAMEALRTAFGSRGLTAEVANATNRDGKVEGRLRVSSGGKKS